jgi:L-fuconolactonase
MGERIDAQHRLWRYSKEEYDWIGPGMEPIARDFLLSDLQAELTAGGFDGSVVVQARQSLVETDWLLAVAASSTFIRGVVGWAPIADAEFPGVLERFKEERKLKALRHIIQGEKDEEFILRNDFNAGIKALARSGTVYDILIYERHLPATIEFVDRHPNQVFVLDHIGKPRIKERALLPWKTNLFELAKRDNVYCKLSGLVTEADWKCWTAPDLLPYADAALEAFGPARVMFGSDWPVCLLGCSYSTWLHMAQDFLAGLSTSEKELVFGGVASKVYSLEPGDRLSTGTQQE